MLKFVDYSTNTLMPQQQQQEASVKMSPPAPPPSPLARMFATAAAVAAASCGGGTTKRCDCDDRMEAITNTLSSRPVTPPVRPSPPLPPERTKLFIGNLPPNITLYELVELFETYGEVNMQLSVVKDDNYAFIHYYDEKSAEAAIQHLNGMLFRSRYIRVEYSVSDGHLRKLVRQKPGLYQLKSKSSYDIVAPRLFSPHRLGIQVQQPASPMGGGLGGLRAIRGGTSSGSKHNLALPTLYLSEQSETSPSLSPRPLHHQPPTASTTAHRQHHMPSFQSVANFFLL